MDQRPADRELLLLAARQVAAAALQHGLQHREELEHLVRDLLVLAADRRKAGLEVLLHRQQRKDLAPLRHQRHAAPRALVGRQLRDFLTPSSVIVPGAIGCRPEMARRRLVLPTPLRPSRQVTRPIAADSDTPRSAWAAP
jgi:hypothetical protein